VKYGNDYYSRSELQPVPDYLGRLAAPTNFRGETVTVNVREKNEWAITVRSVQDKVEVSWDPVPGATAYFVYMHGATGESNACELVATTIEPAFIGRWSDGYSIRVIAFGNEGFGVPSEIFKVEALENYERKVTDKVYSQYFGW
jgi:hypothetical protein